MLQGATIVFDLDGTLVDTAPDLTNALNHALKLHGHPYVEPAPGHGKGLLSALAENACVVVTDDFPCFFLPRMLDAASRDHSLGLRGDVGCLRTFRHAEGAVCL